MSAEGEQPQTKGWDARLKRQIRDSEQDEAAPADWDAPAKRPIRDSELDERVAEVVTPTNDKNDKPHHVGNAATKSWMGVGTSFL